jgi:type IV pilus assembly protein PilC
LKTAFDLVLIDYQNKKEGKLFESIRDIVLQSDSLSEALRKQKGKFSDYEYYSVQIGEETGKLGEVLKELTNFYKNKIAQRRKIISALTYPIIVLCTSFGAVFIMLKFIVPMFADVFIRFGGELPWITAFILLISNFIDQTFWYGILFFVCLFAVLVVNKKKTWYRKWASKIILRIPLA